MIIDAHAHIFREVNGMNKRGPTRGLGYGRIAAGDEQIQLMPPLCPETMHTPEMLIAHMDLIGIDKAVLLQGPFYGECNQYVSEAVRKYPGRLIGVAYVDPWDAKARSMFEDVCGSKEFVGVKLECSEAAGYSGIYPNAKPDDPNHDWLWAGCERNGLVLVLDLGAVGSAGYQTAAVRGIATKHPKLTVVIAHLAQPTPAVVANPSAWALWKEQLMLGLLPNVYFDTASLPAYVSAEGYPFPTAGKYLRQAIGFIGEGKVMWGTDIPGLLPHATYKQLLQAGRTHLTGLPDSAVAQVMGENALKVYRRTSHTSSA